MIRRGDAAGAVLAVCGLASEARLAAGPGVRAIAGGGDAAGLAAAIEREIADGARALVSFGLAGALDDALRAGDVLVATAVRDSDGASLGTDAAWSAALRRVFTGSTRGVLVATDRIVATVAEKSALRARSGAVAVDMESHHVARLAAAHGLPFVVLRAIADSATRSVPHAATVAMRAGRGIDLPAVLGSLLRRPGQVGDLIAVAGDARRALDALGLGRRRLGRGLGLPDLDDLAVDVV